MNKTILSVAGALLIFFGIPIFIAAVSVMSGWVQVDCVAAPSPSPAIPQIPVVVDEAVRKYVSANWSGWTVKGYDADSFYNFGDESDVTVWVERDGHSESLDLRVVALINGSQTEWIALPDHN